MVERAKQTQLAGVLGAKCRAEKELWKHDWTIPPSGEQANVSWRVQRQAFAAVPNKANLHGLPAGKWQKGV